MTSERYRSYCNKRGVQPDLDVFERFPYLSDFDGILEVTSKKIILDY